MESMTPPSTDEKTDSPFLSQVMIASILITFFIVALLFFLHLYAKWYWSRNNTEDPTTVSWRRRAGRNRAAPTTAQRRGLDPSTLMALPIVVYNPKDYKEELECAVCLSELSQGEKVRILPKCDHGFHVDCIDMWFESNSTCPLCRTPMVSAPTQNPNENNVGHEFQEEEEQVVVDSVSSNVDHGSSQNVFFPTNVLFWGDETQVSSLGVVHSEQGTTLTSRSRDHELVIDIPRGVCEDRLCSPPQEEKSPMMTRLRSLKRLLSRGKRVAMDPSPRASTSGSVGVGVEKV